RLMHLGGHKTGRDRIHADVRGHGFRGEAFGQPHDGRLRTGIGTVVRRGTERAATRKVDDARLCSTSEKRQKMTSDEICPFEIALDRAPPAVAIALGKRAYLAELAGAIDQYIDRINIFAERRQTL